MIQGILLQQPLFGFIIPPTTAPGDYRIRMFYNTYKKLKPRAGDEGPYSYFSPCQTFDENIRKRIH
jgi:hypothetical protein